MPKTATNQQVPTNPASQAAESQPTTIERVKQDFNEYWTYTGDYRDKWEDFWKLWNNERINIQYEGDNNSFEPMTFQMVETIVDNVYGTRPKMTFLPTSKDQETDTKMINGLWDYSWDKSDMDDQIPAWGREVTIAGNGFIFPEWGDGYMDMKHIPLRDCIYDTAARRPNQMRFAGYRRLDMIENLRDAKWFDATKNEWVPRYKNLDKIVGTGNNGDFVDKEIKERIYTGSTLTATGQRGQVEVIYMIYKDKIVEVANRDQIIFEQPNPFHREEQKVKVQLRNNQGVPMYDETSIPEEAPFMSREELEASLQKEYIEVTVPAIEPFIPVVMHRGFVDDALLLAKGDVEAFASTQEELNDSLNVKKDNVIYSVQNIGVIDQGSKEAIPLLAQAKPGAIIPIKNLSQFGSNTFRWMEKPNYTAAADADIERAKRSIRDTARVDEVAQGVTTSNDRTATEVKAQVAQASTGFATKARALESGPYKQLGEIFVKFMQIFLTEEQLVRVIGKNGVEFKNFVPGKYWGPYDVKVVLEEKAKAQQQRDAEQAVAAYGQFKDDPYFNQLELRKMVARKAFGMDDDDLELLINPNPENMVMMGDQATGDASIGTGAPAGGLPPQITASAGGGRA